MYVPKHFEERDLGMLHALLRARPLGTWVTKGEQGMTVNHIPFQLDETRGAHGTLVGHVSRQNPVWKALTTERASVVVFQGSQGYITPSWYQSKQDHAKVVSRRGTTPSCTRTAFRARSKTRSGCVRT